MDLTASIKVVQQTLGLEPDGIAGPRTWEAILKAVGSKAIELPQLPPSSLVDPRSEANIATLNVAVQPLARQLVRLAEANGITIKVTSGTRTYAEQDELFAQGRDKPGERVTNARGGQSNHNFGVAFDVTVFQEGVPKYESPSYAVVGKLGKSLGLYWGGDWHVADEPHFELRPSWAAMLDESAMLAEFRRRTEVGQDILT